MNLNIKPLDIEKTLFKGYTQNDNITMYELMKILMRFTKKSRENCQELAYSLIEKSTDVEKNEWNFQMEINLRITCKELKDE